MFEKLGEKIANSFLNYLHLSSWLEIRAHSLISNRRFSFRSIEDVWKDIFNESLRSGDIIQIHEGFLTDWLPKVPGQSWKSLPLSDDSISIERLKRGGKFAMGSILENKHTPLGVVRLPFGSSNKNYAVLSITTYDCWSVELAIPVLVSKEVYFQFLKARSKNQAVEGTIEVVLEIGNLPFDNTFLTTMESEINPVFFKQFLTPFAVPPVYLRLESVLNAKFRTHNTHPPGGVWAISKHEQEHQIIHNIDNGEVQVKKCKPYEFIDLNIAHIDISNSEIVEQYSKAFTKGDIFIDDNIRTVTNPSKKVTVLTEFDAQKRYFPTSIPITNRPWLIENYKSSIISTLNDLKNQ
jgi:hypothetical protein